ncbi:MAG: DUF1330 domain-containing protein [Actinobacteria bacterium]|nr:DUF1330 domain-containing protein [Actinomycetota bacterium]
MSVYFIVNSTITDPAGLDDYVAAVGPTIAGRDMTLRVVTNEAETVEGQPAGSRVVVIEFPDRDGFRSWYDSPEYQAVIGLRLASTVGFAVLVDGVGGRALVDVARAALPVGGAQILLQEAAKGALTWGFAVRPVSLTLR